MILLGPVGDYETFEVGVYTLYLRVLISKSEFIPLKGELKRVPVR
jgi:hypothetical protein